MERIQLENRLFNENIKLYNAYDGIVANANRWRRYARG